MNNTAIIYINTMSVQVCANIYTELLCMGNPVNAFLRVLDLSTSQCVKQAV